MYRESIVPALMEKHGYRSPLQAPRVLKIVLNMGVGEAVADRKMIDNSMRDLTQIAAQKPIPTLARKSIAAFKLRQGVALGCKVTLRRRRMFDFLDRLVSIALRARAIFKACRCAASTGRGNYSLGVAEQIVFTKSNTSKSMSCAAWMWRLSPTPKATRRRRNCCACSVFRCATIDFPDRRDSRYGTKIGREPKHKTHSPGGDASRPPRRGAREIRDPRLSVEERQRAIFALQKMPRDGSAVRVRNRCLLTGRPRGVFRRFGLGRTKVRELAMNGEIPGVIKASW